MQSIGHFFKMDLVVHDRASVIPEEKEDRISNLPDDIIYHILSFLDMKYAVRTCILSKRWKHTWTVMPNLNSDSTIFRTFPRYAKFVDHALSCRNSPKEVYAVNLTFTERSMDFVINNIVNYAYSHNVSRLSMSWINSSIYKFPQHVFRSQTLKHLTLSDVYNKSCFPSAWDFPVLETLILSSMCLLGDITDRTRSIDIFSKCVNLKELTLHQVYMFEMDFFNVWAPQLSNLTISDPFCTFPGIFNVVAPQLKNLTATVNVATNEVFPSFQVLQLSTKGFDSLETVNLSLLSSGNEKVRYVPVLRSLFQKLRNAKFLIVNSEIIEALSTCLDELSNEPCPFNNLKCLKMDTTRMKRKDRLSTIPSKVKDYLLENSPTATFIMDLPQVKRKISGE